MTSIKNVNIVCDTDYPSGTGEWTFYIDNMRFISAGELSIQKGPNSPAVWYSAPDKTNVVMLQLQLTAAPIESVKISSITFFASGSGNDKRKVSGVRIYDDANNNGSYDPGVDTQIGIEQSYAMDNGSITFKDVNVTFSPGEVKYWLVTYDFNDKASTGEEFKIGLDNACNVICVGTKSSEPVFVTCPPILGETKIIQSYYSVKEKALETGITLAAFDIDGDPTNGYEYYHDFSGQTNLIISIDGNGNGKIDHFIYTPSEDITRTQNTGGTLPTVYWAPSNDIISLLRYEDVNGDGEKDWVYDSDGDGQYDRYLDSIKNTVRLYNTPVENGVHPRIFTPNGDGYNDRAYFYIDNPNNKDVEVKIYDLYGTRVADDLPEDDGIPYWNGNRNGVESGELMQDGPYIYHIKVGNRLYNGVVILAR
jgi:gliding motility-associated-like protein